MDHSTRDIKNIINGELNNNSGKEAILNYVRDMLRAKLNRAQIDTDNLIKDESEVFCKLKEIKEKRNRRASERNQLIEALKKLEN